MSGYERFDDARIKHLELLQAVIGRLGGNGFLVKGWSLTVAGLFLGFAVHALDWRLGLVSILPTLVFWGLDAYFLRSERLFRELYRRVRAGDDAVEPFYMAATSSEFVRAVPAGVSGFWTTFFRTTLWLFYGAIIVAAGLVVLIIVASSVS